MARYTPVGRNCHKTSHVYVFANEFRSRCLAADDSLLHAGVAVWTPENLQRLHEKFSAEEHDGKSSFIESLKRQIDGETRGVKRLAAELLCVYFLFPSNVGSAHKEEVVAEVLHWAGDGPSALARIRRAFRCGVGSCGQGYKSGRSFELGFLIDVAMAWKRLGPHSQAQWSINPWKFREFIDRVEHAESRQLRHILLHLLFPEQFERIASSRHKRQLLNAFAGLRHPYTPAWGSSELDDSDDAKLLRLRWTLESLLPEKMPLDFYQTPLVEAWHDGDDASEEGSALEALQHKKQIVFYGPSGTGKTLRAKRLARHLIRVADLVDRKPHAYFKSPLDEGRIDGRVHHLQLHESYTYQDFIGTLCISASGKTEYRPGYLLRLIEKMNEETRLQSSNLPHVLILDDINRTHLSRMMGECFPLLEDRAGTIDLLTAEQNGAAMTLRIPRNLYIIGTMNLIGQSIEQIDLSLHRRFLWLFCPFRAEDLIAAAKDIWCRAAKACNCSVEWEDVEFDFEKLAASTAALNRAIRENQMLGPQYEIGHSYLMDVVHFLLDELSPGTSKKQQFLWGSNDDAREAVKRVWCLSLRPLLEKYLIGRDPKALKEELERLSNIFLKPEQSMASQ